jgi:hypothetical protein
VSVEPSKAVPAFVPITNQPPMAATAPPGQRRPAPGGVRPPTPPPGAPPVTVLIERPLRVSMLIESVKLKPPQ